ncbi:tyrosine recombinase XerC [Faecalispora anaeroviscerum]|uniref:tyrosine recombinase XerC n=1 Tax=Faecalispora anaeroviscerum TaxID=2991836 RepID=UPI0024B91C1F|nr:tyrosine recombinase XerC [Faecalispora anaeroviscerum]
MNPKLMHECPLIIREFLGYIGTVKGKSDHTMEEYFRDLRTFFRYIKKMRSLVPNDLPLDEISISDVDLALIQSISLTDVFEYMNYLSAVRGNKAATRARKASSLRAFYVYLTNKAHKLSVNPMLELETPKLKKALPKYLTLEQSMELLNAVDGPDRQRDYCILTLFLNCGMRLSELVGINLKDVRQNASTMRIVGKGNKERVVYLNDACQEAIRQYLEVRPHNNLIDREALFISRQRRRISPKTVQHLVKKYLAKIEFAGPGYSVHKLRHTAATLMYQHGHVDIRVLKDVLGHENLGTTEIYTHLSSQQMRDAANANPLSHVKAKGSRVASAANVEKRAASESGGGAEQEEGTGEKKEL